MEIAVRVLIEISSHRESVPGDIDQLRKFAETGDERTMPIDELACAVILRERQRMEQNLSGMRIRAQAAG